MADPIKKVDAVPGFERAQRSLTGITAKFVFAFAVVAALVHIVALTMYPIDPWVFRAWHFFFMIFLIFLLYQGSKFAPVDRPSILDWVFAISSIIVPLYIIFNFEPLLMRYSIMPTTWDVIVATLLIVILLEATRRSNGLPLPIISVVFLAYAVFGKSLPGILWNRGYEWDRLSATLLTTDGIFYVPIGVSATYVIMFILFGAFLNVSGAGSFFINLAFSIAGGTRGGPAKVAVIASSLMGTVSGSAVGNTVATGVFTIPLMKRVGYKAHFAGAVEAVASTGGQIMPPVMGAAAFIMADILGVSYGTLVIAALVPALLYYLAVFVMVDLEAVRLGLKGLPRKDLPDIKKTIKEGFYHFLPLIVVIYTLVGLNYSPIRAGLHGIITCIAISWLSKENRMGLTKIAEALAEGAKNTAGIAAACACAGIIVGVLGLTGLGGKLGNLIVHVGMINVFLALILTMVLTIVLGMGLPTVAAYAIAGSTVGPALVKLGYQPLPAHMFIFYFACVSTITPPVALSAYAGAGIAGANPLKVAFTAVRLGIVAFIIPYMFILGPELLLIGEGYKVAVVFVTACIGIAAIGASIQGYIFKKASIMERVLLAVGALSTIWVTAMTDVVGFILIAAAIILNRRGLKKKSGEDDSIST